MTTPFRSLPTLEGSWSELAGQVLAPLHRVPGDFYILMNGVTVGDCVITDGLADGDSVVARTFNALSGVPQRDVWHEKRDPRNAGPDQTNRFVPGFDLWRLDEEERVKGAAYRLYDGVGLRWTRRMVVVEDGELAGFLTVSRFRDRPDFSAEDLSALRRSEAYLRRVVSAWFRLWPGRALGGRAAAVFADPSGRIVGATGGAEVWLDAGGREAIGRASRGLEGCNGVMTIAHRGVVARAVRTVGDGGTRYIWVLEAPAGMRQDPLARLSPRQREIATGVGAGLTNREIADRLGVGDETVKTHLQRIYAALGVSNRLELVTRLGV
jgi:DNA-binding CsgD family transcriptional regulator